MNMVDNIARKNAENAVREGLEQMAVLFGYKPEWLKVAGRHFLAGLVGKKETPLYTAAQIEDAFAETIKGHRYKEPPKVADVLKYAREAAPLPAMQKTATQTVVRSFTPEERARNIAFVDAIMARIAEQNLDPAYDEALRVHGKGSPELKAVVDRQSEEMQAWIKKEQKTV